MARDHGPIDTAVLLEAAASAREAAYAPYSAFPVGAAILDEAGRLHSGCNVENAAYPVGTCAEAGAVAAMVRAGGRRLVAIMVVGPGRAPLAPCGACRQRIIEFGGLDAVVILAGRDGVVRECRSGDLLPEAFGPDSLAEAAESGGPRSPDGVPT